MPRPSPRSLLLSATLVMGLVALAGCTNQGLVDRVAQLEQADERLRESLTDLGAPDPDAETRAEAVRAELEAVAARITAVETDIEALRAALDAQVLELDGRITTAELQLEELRASVTTVSSDLATLTSRVNSLEEQLDAHQQDHELGPSGQGG